MLLFNKFLERLCAKRAGDGLMTTFKVPYSASILAVMYRQESRLFIKWSVGAKLSCLSTGPVLLTESSHVQSGSQMAFQTLIFLCNMLAAHVFSTCVVLEEMQC